MASVRKTMDKSTNVTQKLFSRKVKLVRSDYFPFFRISTLPIRVKVFCIFLLVKVALLAMICDFGPSGYECAEELLKIAVENNGKLPMAGGLGGLCGPYPYFIDYRNIAILIILYIIWDIGIYVMLFISEEWVAKDRVGRNVVMNFWRENEIFKSKHQR